MVSSTHLDLHQTVVTMALSLGLVAKRLSRPQPIDEKTRVRLLANVREALAHYKAFPSDKLREQCAAVTALEGKVAALNALLDFRQLIEKRKDETKD